MVNPHSDPALLAELNALLASAREGNQRALGRLLSRIENWPAASGPERASILNFLAGLDAARPASLRIGITGPPGAGKSTLIERALAHFHATHTRVAVLGVDPTSPRSGGALLADRVRWQDAASADAHFLRSMASRGQGGGLAPTTGDLALILEAAGYGTLLIESVGMGQLSADIAETVDVLVVLLVPESGDSVQMLKAGVLEIADLYVVNKADRPGADTLKASLESALEIASQAGAARERPPVLLASATGGRIAAMETARDGIEEVWATVEAWAAAQQSTGAFAARRARQRRLTVERIVREELALDLRRALAESPEAAAERQESPYLTAQALLRQLRR